MSIEFLTKLMSVGDDHLKDAQMLTDYAQEFKYRGNVEACKYFAIEAKERLKKWEDVRTRVHSLSAQLPESDPNSRDAVCCRIMRDKYHSWQASIQETLDHLT